MDKGFSRSGRNIYRHSPLVSYNRLRRRLMAAAHRGDYDA